MTDNLTTEQTSTEHLRKLLDERGVEYETDERNAITKWSTHYGAFVFFARQREGKLLVETTVATEHSVILTPEQAIAATLGGKTELNELLDEFEHECFMLRVEASETRARDDVVRNSYERIRDEFAGRIAVTLWSGTCEQVLADCDDGLMPPFTAHCSACGAEWGFTPKYCHNCGAKVVGVRDERKAVD